VDNAGIKAQNSKKMETTQDSLAITQVLEDILQRDYEGDINILRQIYYSGTLLFGDVKGQPYAKTLDQYLDGVAHRQSRKIPANLLKERSSRSI